MTWKESLSTDVTSVDRQHQELMAAAQDFFTRIHDGLSRGEMVVGLDRLIDLVADHFDHEERVMRNIALPSLATHTHLHRGLLEEIREFREETAMGMNERSPADIEHFLNVWLYRHIVEEDLKIFQHLNRI
ncbi:bacteriohemerythrin [Magnetospirillum sp. 64-120]|uniref:bacteriohemerythrin n=1 Tax=Magnetospirillum sp. 64-120 TaxID=1895778 RepID=UPI0009293D74|nr:bacteriohemerythrin [Magnetospirillum sp. 64-120]OJX79282.1 MAG: hypothetical protein BGO92_12360 [Magnetospirillum sp. 64-120]